MPSIKYAQFCSARRKRFPPLAIAKPPNAKWSQHEKNEKKIKKYKQSTLIRRHNASTGEELG
jgi:hypothetical protein